MTKINALLKPFLLLTLIFGTAAVSSAQYIRPAENGAAPETFVPPNSTYLTGIREFSDNCAAITSDLSETLKKKGRNRLITGGALSLTGLAMYASAIPFYISGASCCIKSRKAAIEAAPCKLAIVF